MFFLRRRRVFIGECDGQAVYYDQKTGEALAAPKSVLLDTNGQRDEDGCLTEILLLLMEGVAGIFILAITLAFGVYSWKSLSYIVLFWLVEFFFLAGIIERGLYKNVRKAKPTTEKVFRSAASRNVLIGKEDFDPADTFSTFLRVFRWAIVVAFGYVCYQFYSFTQKFGQKIELKSDIWLAGIVFCFLFLMYSQNNPARLARILKRYSQGKVKFKEEGE